ncbi:hypothetical protein RJ640_021051 [Escallonia rubra]|uniref:Uncharacterized protein n=1 Tax=Escallonia rubra TaxID=112253 RepID=A0AA88QUB4_9ASTE|nr:hypothetical protein RJ640_021051 [Escallonia rubra]
MRWFDVPGFNAVHAINAWDEEDVIVMVAPNILSVEHTLECMDLIHASVEKVRIDLKTGMVSRHPVSTRNLDFAMINPAYMGKKNKNPPSPSSVTSHHSHHRWNNLLLPTTPTPTITSNHLLIGTQHYRRPLHRAKQHNPCLCSD